MRARPRLVPPIVARYGKHWRAMVDRLILLAPIVVVDARRRSAALEEEVLRLIELGKDQRSILIAKPDSSSPVLSAVNRIWRGTVLNEKTLATAMADRVASLYPETLLWLLPGFGLALVLVADLASMTGLTDGPTAGKLGLLGVFMTGVPGTSLLLARSAIGGWLTSLALAITLALSVLNS
jgi:hypothetical protein